MSNFLKSPKGEWEIYIKKEKVRKKLKPGVIKEPT